MTASRVAVPAARPRRARRPRRAGVSVVLLRRLPGDTPAHRVWAGTKMLALLILTLVAFLNPSWPQLAATGLVVVAAVAAARVPWSAVPRLPLWFWAIIVFGFGLAALGHGGMAYARVVLLSFQFMILSAVIAWTTALADIAPAVRVLGAPLRRLGLPVDEWAVTVALCVRSLPSIVDECRMLVAARRLRPRPRERLARLVVDVLTAGMAVSMRRAVDMSDALTARGGTQRLAGYRVRVGWLDAATLALVAAVCAVPLALGW